MSKKDIIELSPEQQALMARVEASIESGKRFTLAEYEEYLYMLRDISIAVALKKRVSGDAAFLGDLSAADRAHKMVLEYESEHGNIDEEEKEEIVAIDLTAEKWPDK